MRRSHFFRLALISALLQCGGPSLPGSAAQEASPPSPPAADATLRQPVPVLEPQPPAPKVAVVRVDRLTAFRMARDPWLYKSAAADPGIVAAICQHPLAAWMLTRNRHLGEIADSDHYVCRRLTRWRLAAWTLVQNPEADHVIALDPEGIYRAINRDPHIAHRLAKHPMFNQMVVENPDLGEFIARHM